LKIIFMGTSAFAIPSLLAINSHHQLSAVVSQPDRPKGRGKKLAFTPVKECALANQLAVLQFGDIKKEEAYEQIKALEADLIVVVSYGQIIPQNILEYPSLGCINLHASLLPKYRGAAPIQRALMAGEKLTGITTMFMDEGLDTGDIIKQVKIEISEDMDHGELETILAQKGARLLLDTISDLQKGSYERRIQDNSEATYAGTLKKEDEIIKWSDSAFAIHNRVRALSPLPGAFTMINGSKIKIFKTRVVDTDERCEIGRVCSVGNEGFTVQTGNGILEILEIQKEGKKRMLCRDFLRGFKLNSGDILG